MILIQSVPGVIAITIHYLLSVKQCTCARHSDLCTRMTPRETYNTSSIADRHWDEDTDASSPFQSSNFHRESDASYPGPLTEQSTYHLEVLCV